MDSITIIRLVLNPVEPTAPTIIPAVQPGIPTMILDRVPPAGTRMSRFLILADRSCKIAIARCNAAVSLSLDDYESTMNTAVHV